MPSKIKVFGVRGEILKGLMKDPEWRAKLEKAESFKERKEVIFAFAKSKGYEIKDMGI
jgi:hypothetical protein